MFVVEKHSAWGIVVPLKLKSAEEHKQEEAQDQRMTSPPPFGRLNHREESMAEVESRLRSQQALFADIENKRQTDDDKQL